MPYQLHAYVLMLENSTVYTIGQDVNENLIGEILFSQSLVAKNVLVVDITGMYLSIIASVDISPESHIHGSFNE